MSVIPFAADEIKSLEIYARDLCGEHVAGDLWAALYVNNANAYSERYERRSLTDSERAALRQEYAAAPTRAQFTPETPGELMERLQSLDYNCDPFTGELETARRRLLGCVAFEVMTEGGPAVYLDAWANVQRLDFNTYRLTTISTRPGGGREPYRFASLGNRPHPFEGYTTSDPREMFQKVWQMHDDCAADYRARESHFMAEFLALMESGKSYQAAQVEMLSREAAH